MEENHRTKDRIAKIWFNSEERIIAIDMIPTKRYQRHYRAYNDIKPEENLDYSYFRVKANG